MLKEKIGEVNESEKSEIQKLFERKNALKELFLTLNSPWLSEVEKDNLQQRIVEDMTRTNAQYDHWWQRMKEKYSWMPKECEHWFIDFETREVYLEAAGGGSCQAGICRH